MNKRHQLILDAIVSMYIQDREPVASTTLQNHLNIAVSSATLRNEMAALTKLGFLNQPHISAGRVPTNKAYRYYVENLDRTQQLSDNEKFFIKQQFDMLDHDSQRFLQGAAELFSDMFGVTAIIAPPVDKDLRFVNFTILKTGRYDVVLVGVTSQGDVHTRVIKVASDVNAAELTQLAQLINSRLCFICYADIDQKYFNMLCQELKGEKESYSQIIKATLALIKNANKETLHVRGEQYLLKTDDFDANIADILKVLNDHEVLKQIISSKYDGISVVFGDELPIKNIDNVCFISTRYYAGSAVKGSFCIVCPQTVDYQKLFLRVSYYSQLLTQTITGTERN